MTRNINWNKIEFELENTNMTITSIAKKHKISRKAIYEHFWKKNPQTKNSQESVLRKNAFGFWNNQYKKLRSALKGEKKK